MNETLEQISKRIAKEVDSLRPKIEPQDRDYEICHRLVAALGAQEPVAWLHNCSDNNDREFVCVDFEKGHCLSVHNGDTPLYAAPVVNPDWQIVPKSQYAELIQCCEDMATGKGGWAWEDVIDEHRAILTAPEYGK